MEKTRPRPIRTSFGGVCRLCRRQIHPGELVWWEPGIGISCHDGGTGDAVCLGDGLDDELRWDEHGDGLSE